MEQQLLLVPPLKRNLSRAESLALVQIFLNVSLACIAHARELIPWTSSCFSTRYIDQINLDDQPDGQTLYSAFQAPTLNQPSEGQEIKVLVHGGHRRADQILDMLENGVFDALERGHLEGVQVFVTRSSQGELSVLENYHFVFAYEQGRVSSIQLGTTNHTFILGEVHKSFKAATRALLRSLRDLPRLPAHRKFGMSLSYNQTCPILYQPPGFVDKNDFQEGDAQIMCDSLETGAEDVIGMLETGHYQVRVTTRLSKLEAQDSSIDLQDTEMSKQLQAMQKTSPSQSNNLLSTLRGSTPAVKRRANAAIPDSKRLKATAQDRPSGNDDTPRLTRSSMFKSSDSLRKSSSVELESANPTNLPVHSESAMKDSLKQRGARLAATKLAELLVQCYAVECGKADGAGGVFGRDLLAEGKIKRLSRATRISCECGSRQRSSDMLYCDICDGWQHKECYGHNADRASAITIDQHFCYTCLLYTGERKPEATPLSIILLRKAVTHLTTQVKPGTRIDEDFFQARLKPPRWTKEVLNNVLERLVGENLLMRQSGRLFQVRMLRESELHEINEKCASPLASITHLYETTSSGEDPMKRAAGIMQALEAYAGGQDHTAAEGCEELVSYDEFGDRILRWGYCRASSSRPPDVIANPGAATPVRRRKISISRMLINIDSSPSAASATSMDESSRRFRDGLVYNTDFSTTDSSTTAD